MNLFIFGMPIMLKPDLGDSIYSDPDYYRHGGLYCYIPSVLHAKAVVMGPWPMPPIVNAYLATAGDIGAVVTQIICILLSIIIYLPFVIVMNRSTTKWHKKERLMLIEIPETFILGPLLLLGRQKAGKEKKRVRILS